MSMFQRLRPFTDFFCDISILGVTRAALHRALSAQFATPLPVIARVPSVSAGRGAQQIARRRSRTLRGI
jgi:hypothetical protein